jgi:MFS family permease
LCAAVFGNFFLSIGMVLMPAYGLGLLSEKAYGVANGLFGGGMIAGGIVYGLLEKRFKNIQLFVWTAVVTGALYGLYGFSRSVWSLAALNFCIAVTMTLGNAAIMTIWQLKVPEEYQGRVLSAMRMVAYSVGPISYLLAGPLADGVVPKLFVGPNALADLLNRAWGGGKASQLGFLFSVMGVLMAAGFVISWLVKDVRRVEDLPV